MKKLLLSVLFVFSISFVFAENEDPNRPVRYAVKGIVRNETGEPVIGAAVYTKESHRGVSTDKEGLFRLTGLPAGNYTLVVSYVGYQTLTREVTLPADADRPLSLSMTPDITEISHVEVFGDRFRQPEKLETVTRMPLRPSEQIQSISIISQKVIDEQGITTVTDAARNVPGVTLFGSYGGVRESMSIRGYRGVPILKNGVRIDSDFRTASAMVEMQGIESVQVLKGSAAVTQGVGNDLGAAGGVINVVTKTPRFTDDGQASIRVGSWGAVSPAFDVQTVLDQKRTAAFRINGLYSRADNYRPVINSTRQYINPSFEWRPNEKTTVTLELDYMNDNRTPYTSAQNLGPDNENHLYLLPESVFLGTRADNVHTQTLTYTARINHYLTDNFSIRAAFLAADNSTDNTTTSLAKVDRNDPFNTERRRSLGRSMRDDKNTAFQLDFIGKDVYTGPIKHTFQVGFDYKTTNLATTAFSSIAIDQIDLLSTEISNDAPDNLSLTASDPVKSSNYSYGLMAQEVMTINKYLKAVMGVRYSYLSTETQATAGRTNNDTWDPIFGLIVSPIKNINLFGSYTTTTDTRSAARLMEDKSTVGPTVSKQWEVGVKSDWFDNRLRFNFTYFDIIAENLSYAEYDGMTPTTYYGKAGDLHRRGIETEVSGRILNNLQVMVGYAYLDAQYKNSPSYQNGSHPMNAPRHTANGWVYYTVASGPLRGLSAGAGAYYVGKRPVNEWSLTPSQDHGGAIYWTGERPFDMPDYTTVNLQLAYTFSRFTARVFFNNIFDEVGYSAYFRGGYINQTDPFNVAGTLIYRF